MRKNSPAASDKTSSPSQQGSDNEVSFICCDYSYSENSTHNVLHDDRY